MGRHCLNYEDSDVVQFDYHGCVVLLNALQYILRKDVDPECSRVAEKALRFFLNRHRGLDFMNILKNVTDDGLKNMTNAL